MAELVSVIVTAPFSPLVMNGGVGVGETGGTIDELLESQHQSANSGGFSVPRRGGESGCGP